jgi:glycosyltransferase involved in cell wall biosynthesis
MDQPPSRLRPTMSSAGSGIGLSVVVPLLDEEGSLEALVGEVGAALGEGRDWELLLVDDGSADRTAEIAARLSTADARVRLIRLARRYGQSTAMQAGFDHARGRVMVTLDGDGQNDPADIPRLVARLADGYDLVVGYRVRRKDRPVRKVPSWIANRLIRAITGVPVRDNGCSLKAYRRDVIDRVRLYSDMHRFIPALAVGVAGARVTEIPVAHRPRTAGRSKYGLSRVFRVLADLVTVKMVRSFRDRPLALFSVLAAWASLCGTVSAAAAAVAYATFPSWKAVAFVLPGVALLWFSLAGFLLLLGLVAEVVLRARATGPRGASPMTAELSP